MRSVPAAMLEQEFFAAFGDCNPYAHSRDWLARDIAAIDGVFPVRQTRARGSPGLDHLGIDSRFARDPFDEIEYQRVCWLSHRISSRQKAIALLRDSNSQLP